VVGAGPQGGGLPEAAAGCLFHRAGCASPFRMSRMLALAAWRGSPTASRCPRWPGDSGVDIIGVRREG